DQDRGSERRGGAESQEEAAPELGEAGEQRGALSGVEPQLLEEAAGSGEPVAAEPAEELLRAVGRQREPGDQAKNQETEIHVSFSLVEPGWDSGHPFPSLEFVQALSTGLRLSIG